MAIHELHLCIWRAGVCSLTVVPDPTWSAIDAAIRALDGGERNDLYLHLPSGEGVECSWLAVGGGSVGYVVNGSIKNERFPVYIEPGVPAEPEIPLVVGGQVVDWPRNEVISLDEALRIVRCFYQAGSFSCGVNWQYK